MLGEGFLLKQRNLTVESGHIWREQRRFAFRVFRDLGFGKQVMEESIKDEIGYLLNEIEKNNENPINMHELLMPSVSNNICSLIFGHRYDYNDPIRKRLNILFPRILELLEVSSVSTFLPFVYKAMQLFGSSRMTELMSLLHEFESIVEKEVEIHQKDARNDVNDYIDAFLREMHEREKLNKDMGSFSFQRLYSNSKGFFIAGSFTTRNTLDWILKLIAAYPDVQKCVHDEIDAVIGHNRLPAWSDRQLMPYTQAVIMESQRWCCVVPLNIPRRAMNDTTISGKFIPKDTEIVVNFWSVFHDETIFENPDTFDPQRFLSNDGRELKKVEELIPFSYGKRACVGEILAKMELFLYFTSIMQKYKILFPEGVQVSFESTLGINLQPIQEPVLKIVNRY
ncbi:Cytochrome P450 2J6-like protein [Dinothrombium tinctorium]|uniref:Cytochrome P450 2J6-like protein n=1 Tax=Dinothrombium tinctorium TaxID=1965070 RepID=A0A443QSC8_9ACAR|nr:Cytochrome P450 2J6-like protein [Dinothrombium tinctorium]